MRRITLLLLLTGIQFLQSQQNLDEGFELLENGNFAQAEQFFAGYLQTNPEDFTAQICYGRAMGLNQQPERALSHFQEMKDETPDNLEINLNYAEALLWNRKFETAKTYYESLNQQHPDNYKILLGYANTLSNVKEYELANTVIKQALEIEPNNAGLLNSQKYIHLGWAYQLSQNQEFEKALNLLKKNQDSFPADVDTYQSIYNIYIQQKEYAAAEQLIQDFQANSPEMEIIKLEQTALVAHLQNKNTVALKSAKEALQLSESNPDIKLQSSTIERYIQSLIWNKKFGAASQSLNLYKENLSELQILQLTTQLESYKANFGKVIDLAQNMYETDSASFDAIMGSLNAYIGAKDYTNATRQWTLANQVFPNQPDVQNVKEKMLREKSPKINAQSFYTQDNGNNNSYNFITDFEYPFSYQFKVKTGLNLRNTVDFNSEKSTNTSFYFGAQWQFSNKWLLDAQINRYQSAQISKFYKWFPSASLSYQMHALSSIQIGYNEMAENFNSKLAASELLTQNYFGIINLFTNYKLGLYTQLMHSNYTDQNKRNLVYSSLYYTFGNRPVLKIAMNYQHISFAQAQPELYFSPEKFSLIESMLVVESPIFENKNKQWLYLLTVGVGSQKIEQNQSQLTSRFRAELGYKFSPVSSLKLYGGYTNIATSNAAGFAITELGIRFNLIL